MSLASESVINASLNHMRVIGDTYRCRPTVVRFQLVAVDNRVGAA